MNWLILLLISVNLLLGYLVYIGVNKNGRHLGLNRWYLIGFPLFAIAIGLIYHYSGETVLQGFSITLPVFRTSAAVASSTTSSTIDWVLLLYTLGVLLSLLHFAYSMWTIRTPRDAKFLSKIGKQSIYLISNKQHSFSHFNSVYLSEFQLNSFEFILKHEVAHCQQKHSFDLLLIRLIRAIFWFNPVIYLWELRMKENHEYLADRSSISSSEDVKPYSYALLSSHFGVAIPDLANGFNRPSLLQKRIIQLKTQNTIHMKQLILVPAILVGVVLTTSIQLDSNSIPLISAIETGSSEMNQIDPALTSQQGDIDKKPEFVGGMTAMTTYLQDNVIYPKDLADKNLEAKVFVKFTVSKTGEVKDVAVRRGSEHQAFNNEAIRVISIMPKWNPGIENGKAVDAEMTIPIQFALTN